MMTRLLRGKWRRARSGERRRVQRHAATQTTALSVVGGAARRQRAVAVPPVPARPLPPQPSTSYAVLPECRDAKMRHNKFVEYEELVLRRPVADRPRLLRYRSRAQPPLGITLCYGSFFGEPTPSDAADTNIFVAAVDPGSVAGRDGRIRVGDQILQINGVSIHTRRDAIDQFTAPNELVRLLLARTPDDVNETDPTTARTHLDSHNQRQPEGTIKLNPVELPTGPISIRCNSAAEKATDSGLSRGTDDSEDHDTPLPPAVRSPKSGEDELTRIILEEALEADLTQLHREMETIRLECERLFRRQATSSLARHQLNTTMLTPKSREIATATEITSARLPQLSQFSKIEAETAATSARRQSAHLPLFTEETSSSAYNTGGDSCRSTPLKHDVINGSGCPSGTVGTAEDENTARPRQLELNCADASENIYHTIDTPTTLVSGQHPASLPQPLIVKQFRLPKLRIRDERLSPSPQQLRPKAPQKCESTATIKAIKACDKKEKKKEKENESTDVTLPEQLAETIAYQQRLLREVMIDEATILSGVAATNAPRSSPPPAAATATANIPRPSCVPRQSRDGDESVVQSVQFEWKVRRRPDGTRYITRRPVRTQAMKAREEQVNRERFALSTDDDAASELKVGRFWSRDERKRHLERAKQRKLRHMKLIHEKAKQAAAGEKEQLQFSRAKAQRRNKHNIYDRFTTVQELLAHGAPYSMDDTTQGAARVMKVTTV